MAITGYPPPIAERHGCKVSWYTYADRKTANQAARVARKDAAKYAAQGYDFGYCVPGTVRENDDGTFEVTLP